jgi:branched-chain amino acid transport system ATP-binding protein
VISDLRKRGVSSLIVEENVSRGMEIADHLYLIDDGKVVWRGASGDIAASEGLLATYLGG